MSSPTDSAGAKPPRPPVVVCAGPDELPGAHLRVAGLTVLERAARQWRRKGHPVVIAADPAVPRPRPRYWPAAVELVTLGSPADREARSRPGAVVVPGDVVRPNNRDDAPTLRVTDEPSRRRAEDAVFAELLRGDLGFVARHLNKPVSFRITRYVLCRLPVTPNQITVGAGLVAVLGAALIATGQRGLMIAGFLLAHLQSILDGCDGELARVRFQQSDIGEWLDTIVDDALNFLLTASIGVGLWRATGSTFALAAGLTAAGMLLVYNAVAYRELVRQGEGGEVLKVRWWFAGGADLKNLVSDGKSSSGLFRAVAVLGRRDFFVLAWLVLAAAGLPEVVLLYVCTIAAINFVVAVGQLVWRLGRHRSF